jgi:hypothetical protein
MSDDTELRAIADGICQAYNVGLEDVHQVHVFSNSSNMLQTDRSMMCFVPIWQKLSFLNMSGDESYNYHAHGQECYAYTNLSWSNPDKAVMDWFKTSDHLHLST